MRTHILAVGAALLMAFAMAGSAIGHSPCTGEETEACPTATTTPTVTGSPTVSSEPTPTGTATTPPSVEPSGTPTSTATQPVSVPPSETPTGSLVPPTTYTLPPTDVLVTPGGTATPSLPFALGIFAAVSGIAMLLKPTGKRRR